MNTLKDLREGKDLTQSDITKELGLDQVVYSKYENEKNNVPVEVLRKLAKFYDTSIDYLLYLTDTRKAYPKSKIEENDALK